MKSLSAVKEISVDHANSVALGSEQRFSSALGSISLMGVTLGLGGISHVIQIVCTHSVN